MIRLPEQVQKALVHWLVSMIFAQTIVYRAKQYPIPLIALIYLVS